MVPGFWFRSPAYCILPTASRLKPSTSRWGQNTPKTGAKPFRGVTKPLRGGPKPRQGGTKPRRGGAKARRGGAKVGDFRGCPENRSRQYAVVSRQGGERKENFGGWRKIVKRRPGHEAKVCPGFGCPCFRVVPFGDKAPKSLYNPSS